MDKRGVRLRSSSLEARHSARTLVAALLLAALGAAASLGVVVDPGPPPAAPGLGGGANGSSSYGGLPPVGPVFNVSAFNVSAFNVSANGSSDGVPPQVGLPQIGPVFTGGGNGVSGGVVDLGGGGLTNATANGTQDNNSSSNNTAGRGVPWNVTVDPTQPKTPRQAAGFDPSRLSRLVVRYSLGSGIPNHLSGTVIDDDLGNSSSGNSSLGGAPTPTPIKRRSSSPLVDSYYVKSCFELAIAVDECANNAAAEENEAQQQGRAPRQRRCLVSLTCGPAADYRCVDSYGAPVAMVYRGSGSLIVRAGPSCALSKPRMYGGATERPFFSVGGARASMTLQGFAIDGGGVRRGTSASAAALLSLANTDITNCSATYAGAALLAEGTPVSVSGGAFTGNTVKDPTGDGYGAAFCILTGDAPPAPTPGRPNFVTVFNRASFKFNSAPSAGALFLWKSSPAGIRVVLSRVSFRGNTGGECSSLAAGRADAAASGAVAGPLEISLQSVTFAVNQTPNKTDSLVVCGSAAKPFEPSVVTFGVTTAQ